MKLFYLLNILLFLINLHESFSGCVPSKKKSEPTTHTVHSGHVQQGAETSVASSSYTHTQRCQCRQYNLSDLIEIKIPINNKEIILNLSQIPIGSGGYSSVYHAYWPKDKCYALKSYGREDFQQERNKLNLNMANNEVKVLEYFNELNENERNRIIKMHESSKDRPSNHVLKYIVLDLAGINLEEYYKKSIDENIHQELIINIIKCAAKALYQFHEHGIHLDIKATNFVIPYGHNQVQPLELCLLIDFSGSVLTKEHYIVKKTFVGTEIYNPPEYKNMTYFHRSFDIYSFGVMIYKFLVSPKDNIFEVDIDKLGNGTLDNLAKKCMNKNHEERPNILKVLEDLEGGKQTENVD